MFDTMVVNKLYFKWVKGIEQRTGLSIDNISNSDPSEIRMFLENKSNKKHPFVSVFPSIGRGNVLRDNLYPRDAIDKEMDLILK